MTTIFEGRSAVKATSFDVALDLLARGGRWHAQPGWLDFDGI